MPMGNTQHIDRVMEFLREKRGHDATFADILALAEIAAQSLQSFFASMDTAIYRELCEIAQYIASTKGEIRALQANELKNSHIPSAGHELDAIVKSTENATNTIMECAETLMAADASDPAAYKALVDAKMMVIFEACSFQDLTGQRIAKVVETLQRIDARVTRFVAATGAVDVLGYIDEHERKRAERKEALILHGPQLDGEGIDQTDVDSLMRAAS